VFVFREIAAPHRATATHDSFPGFDWLRFVLASVVALGHEGVIRWPNSGNFAVQVFFALSGWLIGGILLRTELRALPRFYYNRATRIWIPFFIAVAVLYTVSALRDPVTASFWKCLFYDTTFTHNYFILKVPEVIAAMPLHGTGSHFWSISVEEQFYLAAPLLIVLLPFGRRIWPWVMIAAAANVSQFWYGSIILGVLAAVVRTRYGDWQFTRTGFGAVLVAGASLFAALVAFPDAYAWIAPPLAVSIVLGLSWSGKRSRVGEFLGGVSYPLYLYHWIGAFAAGFLAHRLGLSVPALAAYGIAVIAGTTAYVVIDRNVMNWRGHFYRPEIGRALMIAAYGLFASGVMAGAVLGLGVL
jgi:peptidoglycan/LPS O-acetylase OafA/YrhL